MVVVTLSFIGIYLVYFLVYAIFMRAVLSFPFNIVDERILLKKFLYIIGGPIMWIIFKFPSAKDSYTQINDLSDYKISRKDTKDVR